MASRRRFIHKYKDDRFELLAWIDSTDGDGIFLRFTDKVVPEHNLGASWTTRFNKDWVDFIKCLIAHIQYINKNKEQ